MKEIINNLRDQIYNLKCKGIKPKYVILDYDTYMELNSEPKYFTSIGDGDTILGLPISITIDRDNTTILVLGDGDE